MQVLTQRLTDKTSKEESELRKEMNEMLEKMISGMKNSRSLQSASSRKYYGITTSKLETPNSVNKEDGEIKASDTDDEENEIQNYSFRPSGINELRTPIPPVYIQKLDLDDTVIVNIDRTGEDYHNCD